MNDSLEFLGWRSGARVLIVSPHPDDEVIGAGARLPFLEQATVVQVTDGSPKDMADALALGFRTREDYAKARTEELRDALALAGNFDLIHLGVSDQEASLHMAAMADRLDGVIEETEPDYVLSVPYEGGHPDHDATALAVHQACARIDEWKRPVLIEMLSYHNEGGVCQMCAFLNEAPDVLTFELSPAERTLKRQMFECFRTQRNVLQWFPIGIEKFRIAPAYDFAAPPHPGQLYYEMFPWGMQGEAWRALATEVRSQEAAETTQ